jgi:ATP-dependent exoDNAse (exonuclease V) alpha subunit
MTQKEALKVLKMGKNVFLTGPAGSGKTYLLNDYIDFLKERGVEVAVTASTGIAATHLKGMTIHSWSGIGIKDTLSDQDLDFMEQKQYLYKRYEKTKVLIIDEISMLNASILDCVDKVAKMFKRNNEPFGGMQVIFSGDFFQLPPIQKKVDPNTIFSDEEYSPKTPFAFTSKAWQESDLHICYLNEQHRQKDNELLNILNSIRDGVVDKKIHSTLKNRVEEVDDEDITKLFTHNINVDSYNQKMLDTIKEPSKVFKMTSKGNNNLIETLKRSCLSPENLTIKKDALVMFVKNNPTAGYINGTIGRVIDFEDNFPVVETQSGERFVAMPQPWSVEEGDKVLAQIKQVPLKLAWAVTIHKSQGMTLDRAYMDLSQSFVEGQGYVALSRIQTLEGLFLKGFNEKSLEIHSDVREMDDEFRDISDEIFEKTKKIKEEDFEKEHKEFLEKIDAKKYKVSDSEGKRLSTFQITKTMLLDRKTLDEIAKERKLTQGTIISHIEKLKEEKSIKTKDINYLRPDTKEFVEMLDEIEDAVNKKGDDKLTLIFQYLDGKYSYNDIKFVKIFL